MKKTHFFLLFAFSFLIGLTSCKKDDNDSLDDQLDDAIAVASDGVGKSFYKMPESTNLSAIPQDPNNPLTAEKVALGMLLYHETGIAISPEHDNAKGTYSCASCHFASAGFQAGRFQGIAEGGEGFGINGEGRTMSAEYMEPELDVQPIRTPSAMNLAYQEVILWNGQFGGTGINIGTEDSWTPGTPKETNNLGFQGLETQAIAGLKVHRLDINVDSDIIEELGYTTMFDEAFPGVSPGNRYTTRNAGLAIAAYERTLLANQSPFQKYLGGNNNAMTEAEKRGALLFFGDANCANCHNGPGLNSMEFHALGMKDLFACPEETFKTNPDNTENLGRGGFTERVADRFKFKVPQLYNLTDSPFFGHGSSFRSVKEVLEYKNNAIAENMVVPASQLAAGFVPLNLTDNEINDLAEFIESALHDPNLNRYVPESLPSGNCFPFNDPQARVDLGCE